MPYQYGVDNREEGTQDPYTVDASLNWWGEATGPYHDPYNTCGHGNEVSENIIFWPWYSDEGLTTEAELPVYNVDLEAYYCTIQDAIDDAGEGHVIKVIKEGTYQEQLLIETGLTLKPKKVNGEYTEVTIKAPDYDDRTQLDKGEDWDQKLYDYIIRVTADDVTIKGLLLRP